LKNKIIITKTVAIILCIITTTLSTSIYSSYKELYTSNDSAKDSIIYIAAAKTPLKDSNVSSKSNQIPMIDVTETNNVKEEQHKKIFINIIILFLSFISLASAHNFILTTETDKRNRSKSLLNTAINKKTNINSSSSLISKEGVK